MEPQRKIREGLLLFILATVNFVHIMDFVIMMPLNPVLQEVFKIENTEFAALVSSYAISAGVTGFASFFFIDRFDRRTSLLILFTGFTFSTFLCAIAQTYSFFLFARIMAGAFGGILGALILSVIGDVIPEERRGKATGIVMAAFSASSIIGIPLGYELAIRVEWHFPFFILAGLSTVVLILSWFTFPSINEHMNYGKHRTPVELLNNIFTQKNLVWSMVFMFVLMLAGFTVIPFISDYMVKNVGFRKEDISLIYLIGGLVTVISGPGVGKISDKIGKQKMFVIMASFSIIPIVAITNLPPVSKVIAYTVTSLFFVFFGGRFIPAMSMITSSAAKKDRGGFMSINSSVQQISNALATFLGGVILQESISGEINNFYVVGIFSVIMTLIAIAVSFKVKQVS